MKPVIYTISRVIPNGTRDINSMDSEYWDGGQWSDDPELAMEYKTRTDANQAVNDLWAAGDIGAKWMGV